ncbi:MAG TPA: Lsr2 family protein [Actinomycetales bacterium]|nr:Lsr2 family protein [Actinomycetales bacterium]
MAQRTQVILIDDIDGSEAAETISFALDGVNYEMELSEENAEKLRNELGVWIKNARRVSGRLARGRRSSVTRVSSNSATIREWARANGYTVNERGRLPKEIVDAFEAANGK